MIDTPLRHLPQMPDRVKIWFRFIPREGWLPYDKEGLWADRLGGDTARLVSVPFLQDGVAEGDVVRFATGPEGMHWAVERVEGRRPGTRGGGTPGRGALDGASRAPSFRRIHSSEYRQSSTQTARSPSAAGVLVLKSARKPEN